MRRSVGMTMIVCAGLGLIACGGGSGGSAGGRLDGASWELVSYLSTNGTTFGSYARVPTSATPSVAGGGTVHNFTLAVPAGVTAIRLAKYFPYSVTRKNTFVAALTGPPSPLRGYGEAGS